MARGTGSDCANSHASVRGRHAGRPLTSTLAIDFDSTAWPFITALGKVAGCPRFPNGSQLDYSTLESWRTIDELFGVLRADEPDFFDKEALGQMLEMMDQARTPEMLREVGLYEGFVEAMCALQADGYTPLVLTDTSEVSAAAIRDYLAELGLDLQVVRCSGKEKAQWCIDNGAPLLVDDAPHTITDAHAKDVALLTFPYAFNTDALSDSDATVIDQPGDWTAMLEAIRFQLAEPLT
jgi:hypothetical protein